MTPWHWDHRVLYNPLSQDLQDLATWGCLIAAVACVWAALRRPPVRGRRSGRLAALAVIATALIVGAWNWPLADDWAWAVQSRDAGMWRTCVDSYLGWTGRYATYAIEAPYGGLVPPMAGSVLWSWLLIAGLVATAWFALRPALRHGRRGAPLALAAACTGTAIWITSMVWPGHGLYWFCATTTYAVGLAFLLALLGLAGRAEEMRPRLLLPLMALGGLLIGGIGETMPVAILPIAALWTLRAWWLRLPSRHGWTLAVACMAAGLLANALSPGTAMRAKAIADTVGTIGGAERIPLGTALGLWLSRSLADAWAWLLHPVAVLAAVAGAPVCALAARRLGWGRRNAGLEIAAAWLAVALAVLAGYLPSFLLSGHAPPWRARDAIQGLVLITGTIAWIRTLGCARAVGIPPLRLALALAALVAALAAAALFAIPTPLHQRVAQYACLLFAAAAAIAWWRWRQQPERLVRPALGLLLAGALLLGGSFPTLALDAAWTGPRWRGAQAGADATLAAGSGIVRIPRIETEDRPQHLWYWGPKADPGDWINRAVAAWYRCEGMGIWTDAASPPPAARRPREDEP